MANLIDYIKWRGDITFSQSPVNEVDALILSEASYFAYETLLVMEDSMTIEDIWNNRGDKLLSKKSQESTAFSLMEAMANSRRFQKVKVTNFISELNKLKEIQFAALTYVLKPQTYFVTFRGTDNTLIGWKEDFRLSLQKEVPSQAFAVKYLTAMLEELSGDIYVSGHSKGGNLALYSAVNTRKELQDKIHRIYILDGPGLTPESYESSSYKNIKFKIRFFMPEESVVGILMNPIKDYTVIKSSANGPAQHDLISWQVEGTKIIRALELSQDSVYLTNVTNKWVAELSYEEKSRVIDAVFSALEAGNKDTIEELTENIYETIKNSASLLIHSDDTERKAILATLGEMIAMASSEFIDTYIKFPKFLKKKQ